jgi:hypothetical protein
VHEEGVVHQARAELLLRLRVLEAGVLAVDLVVGPHVLIWIEVD